MKVDPASESGDDNDVNKMGSHCQPLLRPEDWVTKAEAARIRGVSRQAIAKLVTKGKFTVLEIAGNTLLKRADVENYVTEPGGRPSKL